MKAIKLLTITAILTMILAIPVFAQEVTEPDKVITVQTFTIGEDALAQEFHNSEVWRSENYIKYLDGVIYNLNETVRIKQEIVTNYKWLSQYNPYYATLIPAAEKDLAEAQAWVEYYKAYKVNAQAELKAKYNY
jgi:hypothetical protein